MTSHPARASLVLALLVSCSHDWERLRPRADSGAGPDTNTQPCTPPRICETGVPLCVSDYSADVCCPDLDGRGGDEFSVCFRGDFLASAAHTESFTIPRDDARWLTAPTYVLRRIVVGTFDPADTRPVVKVLWNETTGLYVRGDQERDDVRLNPAGLQPEALWWQGDAFELFARVLYRSPNPASLDRMSPFDGHFIAIPQRPPVYTVEDHGALVATGGSAGGGFPIEARIDWPADSAPIANRVIAFDVAFDDADTTDVTGTVRDAQITFGASANAYSSTDSWSALVLLGEGDSLSCPRGFVSCSRDLCIVDRAGVGCP